MSVGNTQERHSDLKIVGTSGSNGGVFNKVNIIGDAEINGNLDCCSLKCTGTLEVDGGLRADLLKVSGDVTVKGSLNGGELDATGNVKVAENLTAVKTRFNGEIAIGDKISGEEIKIYGNCTIKNGCQAEQFRLKGAVQTEGTINAERVEIAMFGSSRVAEIVGGQIKVEPHGSWKWTSLFKSWGTPGMEANLIEGDVIRLTNITADVVRGEDVMIGPGCRIRLVEYSKSFHQDRDSEVAESIKGGGRA